MEGLEASIVTAGAFNEDYRFDAQFFQKAYLAEDQALNGHTLSTISEFAFVTDGPHGYHEVDDASPIAMLTAKCARDWFADREGADTIARWVDDANKRSSLEVNDLILSTRGTVGNCAVVTFEALPANLDQDVARIAMLENSPFQPLFLLAYLNSRFGQDYIARHSSGMVQQGLSLAKVRDIPVPLLSEPFQVRVSDTIEESLRLRHETRAKTTEAEDTLLAALGLADWEPQEPLSYTARASDTFATGRFDAEFFHPRLKSLINKLEEAAGHFRLVRLGDYSEPLKYGSSEKLEYTYKGTPFLRIADLNERRFDLSSVKFIDKKLAFSGAETAKLGDILVSRSGTLGLAAPITEEFDDAIFGSYFIRVRPDNSVFNTEFLTLFINSIAGAVQFEAVKTGGVQTNLTISAIENLVIPLGALEWQATFATLVSEGLRARDRSRQTLEAAKRAVEIAIKNGEAAAMAFLDQAEGVT